MNMPVTEDRYVPTREEVSDAAAFLNNCSVSDLVESWNRLSSEWDFGSIMDLHSTLTDSGRIFTLVEGIKELELK